MKKASTRTSSVKRSEEHTSELQSLRHLVCRLLLEKKTHDAEVAAAGAPVALAARATGGGVRARPVIDPTSSAAPGIGQPVPCIVFFLMPRRPARFSSFPIQAPSRS